MRPPPQLCAPECLLSCAVHFLYITLYNHHTHIQTDGAAEWIEPITDRPQGEGRASGERQYLGERGST